MNRKKVAIHLFTLLSLLLVFGLSYLWIGSVRSFELLEVIQLVILTIIILALDISLSYLVSDKNHLIVGILALVLNGGYFIFQLIMTLLVSCIDFNLPIYWTIQSIGIFLLLLSYIMMFVLSGVKVEKESHEK